MTNNIFQKLIVITTMVLSLEVIKDNSAQAAIITYDFDTNLTSRYFSAEALQTGIPDNQGFINGFVSYDDSLLIGIGEEIIREDEGLISFLNLPYNVTSALRGNREPYFATFNNGELIGINAIFVTAPFSRNNQIFEVFIINGQQINGNYSYQFSPSLEVVSERTFGNVQYSLRRDVNVNSVPEPDVILGTCIFGLVALLKLAKNKRLLD
jgi:hypothetical protein